MKNHVWEDFSAKTNSGDKMIKTEKNVVPEEFIHFFMKSPFGQNAKKT